GPSARLSGDGKRMSDHLSNLIARSFTDAPVIRPRVLSLFEPSASKSFDELQSAVEIIAPRAPVASTYVKSSSVEETATTTPITNVSATRTRQREPAPDASTNQRATMSRDRSDSSGLKKIEVETKAISVAEDLLGDGKKNARERDRGIEAY